MQCNPFIYGGVLILFGVTKKKIMTESFIDATILGQVFADLLDELEVNTWLPPSIEGQLVRMELWKIFRKAYTHEIQGAPMAGENNVHVLLHVKAPLVDIARGDESDVDFSKGLHRPSMKTKGELHMDGQIKVEVTAGTMVMREFELPGAVAQYNVS